MGVRSLAAMIAAAAVVFTGCSSIDAPPAEPPEGVWVSVYQPRPDVPKDRMAIQVHNDGTEAVTVTHAMLSSSAFSHGVSWGPDRTATVAPGFAVDLRVDLPTGADCSGVESRLEVTFDWTTQNAAGTASVQPDDPFNLLKLLHDAACLVVRVNEVATLTAVRLDVAEPLPAPAELVLEVDPTGADGTITLDTITSTTLLNPAGADGIGVAELELGIDIDKAGPREVRIPIVPNRCDAHALAEDKVGTRMPLFVTAHDGTSGRFVLAASDALRMQLYAFYAAYCGL